MASISELLDIMARLRDPERGCPWDKEQTFATIAPYTLEEAYEVAEAIESGHYDELRGELGDLLFQVVFYAQMAREQGLFNFDDIVQGIVSKMYRRHPHVFGEENIATAAAQTQNWEKIKKAERAEKNHDAKPSQLDSVSRHLPALVRCKKLQNRAAHAGFDWPDVRGVLDKIDEELAEVKEAMDEDDAAAIEEEVGDLLLVVVNLARHVNVDAETALRKANRKFERRFRLMEEFAAAENSTLEQKSLMELETLWVQAKRRLKQENKS